MYSSNCVCNEQRIAGDGNISKEVGLMTGNNRKNSDFSLHIHTSSLIVRHRAECIFSPKTVVDSVCLSI